MPRERIATRDAVFQAADDLSRRGDKVTVTAVRDLIGGGSNSTIHEILVEWRRARRDRPAGSGNVVPLTTAVPALPDPLRQLMDGFAAQLNRRWTEALVATTSLDDQMAVIRAAAEARVRQAEQHAVELQDEIEAMREEIAVARAERDALATAIETLEQRAAAQGAPIGHLAPPDASPQAPSTESDGAVPLDLADTASERVWHPGSGMAAARGAARESPAERAHADRAAQEHPAADSPAVDRAAARDIDVRLEQELARVRTEREALEREVQLLRNELAARPAPVDGPERSALTEALRASEAARDLARQERDRVRDDLARTREALAALRDDRDRQTADRMRLKGQLTELSVRLDRQATWIQQARARMEQAGLLRKRS
ncbi:MAG: DNA-binding protein [Alphaproteobacteria bacterium]|nr:DNA-binding protein [Alphaproteobacteria bacterium]